MIKHKWRSASVHTDATTATIDYDNSIKIPSHEAGHVVAIGMTSAETSAQNISSDPLPESQPVRRARQSQKRRDGDWSSFHRAALELHLLAAELKKEVSAGTNPNDRCDLIVNIEEAIDALHRIAFGQKECLARCAVAMEGVLLKTDWDGRHVDFIEDASGFLKNRSFVNDETVRDVYAILKEHGLDEFRGVLSS